MNNTTKVGVAGHVIELNQEILHKLCLLQECDYMAEELDKVIGFIVEQYQESTVGRANVNAEEAMRMVALLTDMKRDYAFLSSIKVEENTVL